MNFLLVMPNRPHLPYQSIDIRPLSSQRTTSDTLPALSSLSCAFLLWCLHSFRSVATTLGPTQRDLYTWWSAAARTSGAEDLSQPTDRTMASNGHRANPQSPMQQGTIAHTLCSLCSPPAFDSIAFSSRNCIQFAISRLPLLVGTGKRRDEEYLHPNPLQSGLNFHEP